MLNNKLLTIYGRQSKVIYNRSPMTKLCVVHDDN